MSRRRSPICGVYTITQPNGWVYVGATLNMVARWQQHRKLGRFDPASVYAVLLTCAPHQLAEREQASIDALRPVLNRELRVRDNWAAWQPLPLSRPEKWQPLPLSVDPDELVRAEYRAWRASPAALERFGAPA